MQRHGKRIVRVLRKGGVQADALNFEGECSHEEIDRLVQSIQALSEPVSYLIGAGGGKCVDTAKAVAYRFGIPVVVVPTIASNDAPCSALSIIYTAGGSTKAIEFFPNSPALVVVDTRVIAEAPPRFLAAGIGDAMATYYEARTCDRNPRGRSALGARPALAATALGRACSDVLFESGEAAMAAVGRSEVTDELERIFEVNTLLSGVGFESGGVAAAHSVAQGFPAIPAVHDKYLHGEMVSFGLITHLVLEDSHEEAEKVATFFARIGLPVHLAQLSVSSDDSESLGVIADVALSLPIMVNEPFEVTKDMVISALSDADELGRRIARNVGDEAYKALHGG